MSYILGIKIPKIEIKGWHFEMVCFSDCKWWNVEQNKILNFVPGHLIENRWQLFLSDIQRGLGITSMK